MSNLLIPRFPSFKTLNVGDSTEIKSIVSKYPTYSDFGFTSLLCWDTSNDIKISLLNNNLVVLFQDYENSDKFYSLIGNEDIDDSIKTLLAMSKTEGYGLSLKLVPQIVVDSIKNAGQFKIDEDRDNFDYILSVRLHAELEGAKNEDRRYRIRKFIKKYGEAIIIKNMDLSNHQDQTHILECLSSWEKVRHKKPENVRAEKLAISRLLKFSDSLPVHCIGFYINGTLCAFSVYEYIHNGTAVIHFEKCNLNYKGIAHFVRHTVAKNLHENKNEFINYEQDLGDLGLRKSKEMLHPETFLKKYTISLAPKK